MNTKMSFDWKNVQIFAALVSVSACGVQLPTQSTAASAETEKIEVIPEVIEPIVEIPEEPVLGDSPEESPPITPQGVKPCSSADDVSQCFTVRNAFELRSTLSSLTGVSYQEASVSSVFEEVRAALPMENRVTLINETVANAVYKLAEVYCARMMENSSLASRVLATGVTLSGSAASVFGPQADPQGSRKSQTIVKMLDEFWGLGVDSASANRRQNREIGEAEMGRLFTKLLATPQPQGRETQATLNSNLTSLNVMKALCIPALAGAPVFLK